MWRWVHQTLFKRKKRKILKQVFLLRHKKKSQKSLTKGNLSKQRQYISLIKHQLRPLNRSQTSFLIKSQNKFNPKYQQKLLRQVKLKASHFLQRRFKKSFLLKSNLLNKMMNLLWHRTLQNFISQRLKKLMMTLNGLNSLNN